MTKQEQDKTIREFLAKVELQRKELSAKWLPQVKKFAKGKDAVEFKFGVAICGDTFKLLPELKKIAWGLVVWDPPYLQTDGKAEKLMREVEGNATPEYFYGKYIPFAVKQIAPLVNDSLILFGGDKIGPPFIVELARNGVTLRRANIWLRPSPGPRFTYGEAPVIAGEIFYWLGKTGIKATYNGYRRIGTKGYDWTGTNVYEYAIHSEYPYCKPRKLMYHLVQEFGTPPVIDPMMGWATAPLCLEKLGIPWLGIEIDRGRFEDGLKRFENMNKLDWAIKKKDEEEIILTPEEKKYIAKLYKKG